MSVCKARGHETKFSREYQKVKTQRKARMSAGINHKVHMEWGVKMFYKERQKMEINNVFICSE